MLTEDDYNAAIHILSEFRHLKEDEARLFVFDNLKQKACQHCGKDLFDGRLKCHCNNDE